MKDQVRDALIGARIFYFALHFIAFAIFVLYDNSFRRQLKAQNLPYLFSLFSVVCAAFYLFITTGKNPGVLGQTEMQDPEAIRGVPGRVHQQQQYDGNHPQTVEMQDMYHSLPEDTRSESIGSDSDFDRADDEEDPNKLPKMHYCKECNLSQPYRTRHCDLCEKCIHKFDHHCFWIGGCVGELNHRKFWWLLLFQTLVLAWMFSVALSGLDIYSGDPVPVDTKKITKASKASENSTTKEYGAYMICAFLSFCFLAFTGALLIYHTFLISTNQTTWEHNRSATLDYIKCYPKGFLPFSRGLLENIKFTCFHGNRPRKWTLPAIETASSIIQKSRPWEVRHINICQRS
eukprot:TRINITY_DN3463_c0_g1_i3.p1 TRINITY_DN3463_c0_g1~~TRINITY_DN3463_c0_g1_i3.p1  ORF type:complete len:346 (-),score=52.85 TRINITY_DN3463_c0_g1_i3:394-1431(-)